MSLLLPVIRRSWLFCLFGLIVAAPFPSWAQPTWEPAALDRLTTPAGQCFLADGTTYTGELHYVPETANLIKAGFRTHLTVRVADKRRKLYPEDVRSFVLDQRVFVATDLAGNLPTEEPATALFVQLVDTGRLYLVRRYMSGGTSGQFAVASVGDEWLLRRRSGPWQEIPKPGLGGYSSNKFRKMLAGYFADRPDLLASLMDQTLTYQHVMQAVRAYNSGEPTFFIE